MFGDNYNETPFVQSIFHPSDFSKASENAFAHALALSLLLTTKFTILHAGKEEDSWHDFPAVRGTLQRWGFLKEGSERASMLDEFDMKIKKVKVESNNPAKGIMSYLKDHDTDLIVLSTENRAGAPRWINPSVAEKVAQKSKTKTLFVPNKVKGFVSLESGVVNLNTIIVPVDQDPDPLPAIEYARRATQLVGNNVNVILLHAGTEATVPAVQLPETPGLTWRRMVKPGDVVEAISETALQEKANLIVMATRGRHGFLDALRGSVTEQVLRTAQCPLLAVPLT